MLPPVVSFVEVRSDSPEFYQFVLLELLCKGDIIEVIKGVDGGAQALVVLLFNEQVVERLIDCLVIEVLYRPQVGLD